MRLSLWYWWLRFDLWAWNRTIENEQRRHREFHDRLASYLWQRQQVIGKLDRYK